jgi:hypothetical protein
MGAQVIAAAIRAYLGPWAIPAAAVAGAALVRWRKMGLGLGVVTLLTGCGGPLDLVTGGGPNVAANVQAGAENTQGVRASQDSAQDADAGRDVRQTQERDTRVRTERIET